MSRRIRTLIPVACILAGAALVGSGCMVVHDHPPATAHDGYIHHHAGVELVYVASIGVYRVSGYPNVYYYDGTFYRDRGSYWEVKTKWKGGKWKRGHPHGMPPGLAKK